jgi:Fe2+ or Zn2+ uptake regulation protein
MEAVTREIRARTGYIVDSHRVELFGLCPECAAKERPHDRQRPRARQTRHQT